VGANKLSEEFGGLMFAHDLKLTANIKLIVIPGGDELFRAAAQPGVGVGALQDFVDELFVAAAVFTIC
jgi:hypothetical protein